MTVKVACLPIPRILCSVDAMYRTTVLLSMRAVIVTLKVLLVIGALCFTVSCTSGGGARSSGTPEGGYPPPFKEWQIIDTATGQSVSLDQWTTLLLQQDIIYL